MIYPDLITRMTLHPTHDIIVVHLAGGLWTIWQEYRLLLAHRISVGARVPSNALEFGKWALLRNGICITGKQGGGGVKQRIF